MPKGFQDERYRRVIERLVKARREQGLTQAQVAVALGAHQQFVSRYEIGERRLDIIEFVDVCGVLRCSVVELIEALGQAGSRVVTRY